MLCAVLYIFKLLLLYRSCLLGSCWCYFVLWASNGISFQGS